MLHYMFFEDIVIIYGSNILEYSQLGGYSQKSWVGGCGPLNKTITLFVTKICDIPYPIYDLTFKSKPSSDQC